MEMRKTMVVLQNINKYYHTETSVTQALKKVNLEFHAGEFVAVTGESGSGKSTLLNVISGMDTFEDGELFIEGEPTFQFDAEQWETLRRDKIGFVFQDYHLIGHYSALENITSALLIMGAEKTEAEKRAEEYLQKVGLKGLGKQRASELSSGQKQRLSIARALAKNTPVIMADEPTGNLDSETGEQIIRLLRELSEDRLVIMVTHNYEQAEPYVTRKVSLHDGEVVVDTMVREGTKKRRDTGDAIKPAAPERSLESGQKVSKENLERQSLEKEDTNHTEVTLKERQRKEKGKKSWNQKQKKIALQFADMNRKTQRGRALLFRIFFLFTAVISFVFIGELYANADDIHTRNYDKAIYYQKNDSRLSVQREDGRELTEKDIGVMKSIRNVVQADQYDYVNDINYYIEEGTDYQFTNLLEDYSSNGVEVSQYADKSVPEFLKQNKFMRSITCIEASDLKEGKMPASRNEIVLSPCGKYGLGDEVEIYFTSENIWGSGEYYHHRFKVTGLLKEDTSQIYFHGELCHMLSAAEDGDSLRMDYCYNLESGYMGSDSFYMVIGDEKDFADGAGKGFMANVSANYIVPLMADYVPRAVEGAFPGDAGEITDKITLKVNTSRKGSLTEDLLQMNEQVQDIVITGEVFNHQSGSILEVPKNVFDAFYPRKSTQASVYIKNYTKTDQVIRALEKKGYKAISTYRISSVSYNGKKVMDRLVFIGISLGILLVLAAVEILILRSIMKIRIKDFFVMKSMGMQLSMIQRISFYEMTRYVIEAILLGALLMILLNMTGISFLSEMMIYYGILASFTYIAYNLLLEWATVAAFNRLLRGRIC